VKSYPITARSRPFKGQRTAALKGPEDFFFFFCIRGCATPYVKKGCVGANPSSGGLGDLPPPESSMFAWGNVPEAFAAAADAVRAHDGREIRFVRV